MSWDFASAFSSRKVSFNSSKFSANNLAKNIMLKINVMNMKSAPALATTVNTMNVM